MKTGKFVNNKNIVSMSSSVFPIEQKTNSNFNNSTEFKSNSKISISSSSTYFNKVVSYLNREKGKTFKRI